MSSPGTVASGLAWDWHALWVSDRDDDVIRRIDPVRGDVLATLTAPGAWPGGLGWDGWDLWHSNYYSPSHIYYLDHETGDILLDFPAPQERGMGIAVDGISLWNADYINDTIHELDPATGDVVKSFPAPDDSPHDLAYDGHYLWVVIGGGANMLYQIEPGNKNVSIALAPESATVPAGGELVVNGSLLNHTESPQMFSFHVDVYFPNGNPYPGNPVFGPFTLTMQPGQSFSGSLSHHIPNGAPRWNYLYEGVITQNGETTDRTNFNFIVE
jgi:DNA-binding beta-propeller fold protein YncE